MASQDRTLEFFSLCQSLPPSLHPPSGAAAQSSSVSTSSSTGRYAASPPNDATDELRTFHKTASVISKEIYNTSTLLTELTSLIHSRSGSLFVDESTKVNNLVLKIKSNIESLNTKLDATNELIQRNKRKMGKNSQVGMEASNLVGQLQEEFVNTTKDFKKVLQVRSDRMKERSDRENFLLGNEKGSQGEQHERISLLGNKPKIYSDGNHSSLTASVGGFGSQGGLNSFGNHHGGNENILLGGFANNGPRLDLVSAIMQNSNQQMQAGESTMQLPRPYGIKHDDGSYSPSTGMRLRHTQSSLSNHDGNGTSSSLPVYTPLDIQRMEEQSGQSQMMQLIPDQNYLRERADAMSAVETNIVELGTIFNKLAVMVNEHSEMVQRIEDNVDDANDNILLSLNTLTDTFENLRSNRQLFFRLMAVIVIFAIVFITVFA